jgi:hypothetical protein
MIDIITATNKAKEYAVQVLGQQTYSLEEIDSDEYKGRDVWALTLGYPKRPISGAESFSQSMATILGPQPLEYKTFMVDKANGEVIAMKVRALLP